VTDGAPGPILGDVTVIALLVAAAAALVVVLAAWRARNRRAARRAHRRAVLDETARRIDTAVASLRELGLSDHADPKAPAVSPASPHPTVADGLPGRAALVEALTERVAEARAEGSRIAAAVVRSGADDATTLARNVRTVVDAPVYAVGTRAVALVLPGLGRADALGLLARIEAACHTSGRAVELEQGEDGADLVARLLGSVPAGD
jgi:hypothetical protein